MSCLCGLCCKMQKRLSKRDSSALHIFLYVYTANRLCCGHFFFVYLFHCTEYCTLRRHTMTLCALVWSGMSSRCCNESRIISLHTNLIFAVKLPDFIDMKVANFSLRKILTYTKCYDDIVKRTYVTHNSLSHTRETVAYQNHIHQHIIDFFV